MYLKSILPFSYVFLDFYSIYSWQKLTFVTKNFGIYSFYIIFHRICINKLKDGILSLISSF